MKFYTNNYQQSVNLEHVSYISPIETRQDTQLNDYTTGYSINITLQNGLIIPFWLIQCKRDEAISDFYKVALEARYHLLKHCNS